MHPSEKYRHVDKEENLNFAEKRGFGVWVVNGSKEDDGMPVIATAPFYLTADRKDGEGDGDAKLPTVKAHLMTDNRLVQRLREEPSGVISCTVIVSGPDGYVSPDWYEMENQVPTWNYVTVHLKGHLRLLPDQDLHGVLDALSNNFEEKIADDKPMWKTDKVSSAVLKGMMNVLSPIALDITEVEGTWKLAQAKPQSSREKVAKMMKHYSNSKKIVLGTELNALGELHEVPFSAACENIEEMYKTTPTIQSNDESVVKDTAIFIAVCIAAYIFKMLAAE